MNHRNFTISVICASLTSALSLQEKFLNFIDDHDSIESLSIREHFDCCEEDSDEASDPINEAEATTEDPNHMGDLPSIEKPFNSEAAIGENKPQTANETIIKACFDVCKQQLDAMLKLNQNETISKMLKMNAQFNLGEYHSLFEINDRSYYRGVTQALHQVELKAKGFNNDTVNQSLKKNNPTIASLLGM